MSSSIAALITSIYLALVRRLSICIFRFLFVPKDFEQTSHTNLKPVLCVTAQFMIIQMISP